MVVVMVMMMMMMMMMILLVMVMVMMMMMIMMMMMMTVMMMTKMDRHAVMIMAVSEGRGWERKKGKVERVCRVPWIGPTRLRQ